MATEPSSQEINTLTEAALEIKNLRKSNELMAARLDVFDSMVSIFKATPSSNGYGMAPDVLFDIDRMIEKKKSELSNDLTPTRSLGHGA